MNRTILIVICDFLLVSLLAFSTVDINKVSDTSVERQMNVNAPTNQVEGGRDVTAVMQMALDDERKTRDRLMGELSKTQQTAGEREQEVREFQQQLRSKEEETLRLQQLQTNLQKEFTAAQKEYTAAQTTLQASLQAAQTNLQTVSEQLKDQLKSRSVETTLSKEKLAALEAELKKKADEAAALEKNLSSLSKSNELVLAEKQQLAGKLQVAEVERRHATDQAVKMAEQVKVEREEKAKLAEGVKVLASKSGELTQEIRENRPLAPNTIFNDFVTNRVQAQFMASRAGLIGTNRRKDAQTVLISDGTNTYALCHVQDTPLTLWTPGMEWDSLTGKLTRGAAQLPIRSLTFHLQDPRVVMIPVTREEARQLGSRVYRASADPYKFQDAVLVGATEGYYGECRFEIDLTTPEYVKLDRSVLRGLFGKFNPSRGDLVFSKSGELLGIMANGSYCMMLRNFDAAASFRFGTDVRAQSTGTTLSLLYARVMELPAKLQ
jgi:hypothetical protein